ncbi:MAG: thiaminase II [Thermoleophilia bacterium]|nr:thiaminase II [Thermoleophilia bacterium]
MNVCERLRDDCARVWDGLHAHPFVRELAAGTLPPEKFRFYVEQNLMYLPEYARAMAIGASKAPDAATMAAFTADLVNIVETELPENRELLRRVIELGAADRGGADVMAPANVAYTGFLVATSTRGSALEIMAAILPCAWSYGDIASALIGEGLVHDHPVYAEWIRFFGEPSYDAVLRRVRDDFELLAGDAPEPELARLSELFTMSARLERGFWDMAYGLETWPDVRARHPLA